ncbi:MAG: MFS transporter [Firmicutes bacterium]|nr:MFS transporter [Bacillota bacterium]
MLKSHPLVKTLLGLKGNSRACVWTEPLFGIPQQLYLPYASLYMVALGITEGQIGLIASISMLLQVFSALLSGAITDKLGRRLTTLVGDLISWSIPCLIWAFSRNFTHFLVAAIINSLWRIAGNAWNCLLVEDSESAQLVDIFSWIYIAGLLSAFVAPAAGVFIARYGFIPTVRGLYLFSFVMMTIKAIILYALATETRQGEIRKRETASLGIMVLVGQYGDVFRQILRTPQTLIALGIRVAMNICFMINTNFWAILVTGRLQIPEQYIAIFPFIKAIIMLLFYFLIMPRIAQANFKRPMLTGFLLAVLSQLILVFSPVLGYAFLVISIALEACSLALVRPFMDALVVISVDPEERARIVSILDVIMLSLTSPFGWLAGLAAEVDQRLPFLISIGLFLLGVVLVSLASSKEGKITAAA